MKHTVCICIPVYKTTIDEIDSFSLKQLEKICGSKYDKYLICPDNFDYHEYEKILSLRDVVYFDEKYFKSTCTYSQLCVQYDFYKTFEAYDYMLIYQPDCLIFRDEIEDWCNMNYDYIGSPIVSKYSYWAHFNRYNTPIVGNGGLSLRKISTFMDICDDNGEIKHEFENKYFKFDDILIEDKFFCDDLSYVFDIDKPSWKRAALFAFDMNCDYLADVYNIKNLPMGCHAYDKNIRYWQTTIDIPDEVVKCCENKHEKFFKKYWHPGNKTYTSRK